jgi:hypothetical protein
MIVRYAQGVCGNGQVSRHTVILRACEEISDPRVENVILSEAKDQVGARMTAEVADCCQ